jgi:hypothetical protein
MLRRRRPGTVASALGVSAFGIRLDVSGRIPWLRWPCPQCGEPVSHPRRTGQDTLNLAMALGTDEDARCCLLCAVAPSPLTLDGKKISGAVPDALWRVARSGANSAEFLAGLRLVRQAAAIDGLPLVDPRKSLRRRMRSALDSAVAVGALTAAPGFTVRALHGSLRIRWKRAPR